MRGVNLGSLFIVEEWFAKDEWASMGCKGFYSEWTCVEHLGQEAADAAWDTHWKSWITESDITQIASYGLNTIRIPVGFWIKEDLVYDDEWYPRGGLKYLDRLVGWASDAGLYVIMDLHGAPGSQSPNEEFTGHVSGLLTHLKESLGRSRTNGECCRAPQSLVSSQTPTTSAPTNSSSG